MSEKLADRLEQHVALGMEPTWADVEAAAALEEELAAFRAREQEAVAKLARRAKRIRELEGEDPDGPLS